MNGLKFEKNIIRSEMLESRLAVSPDVLADAQEKMTARFIKLASFRFADTILLYSAIKGEPDVTAIIAEAKKAGKRIAFPKCYPDELRMEYRFVDSAGELASGAYGIPEPPDSAELYVPSPDKHDICIVPAVCYDRNGYRIGYGRGYYDRFLAGFGGTAVGFTLSELLAERLPRGKFDKKVDIIITEKGVFSPK